MRQLALNLKLADFALFDTWYAGPNEAALATVRAIATGSSREVAWLFGPEGSGRSHLLQAAIASASASAENKRCAWLPLSAEGLHPGMLDGMGDLDLLCVDDIDSVAGNADWERALFNVFEALRVVNGSLLVAASAPPGEVPFDLPDLKSRLSSGATWRGSSTVPCPPDIRWR